MLRKFSLAMLAVGLLASPAFAAPAQNDTVAVVPTLKLGAGWLDPLDDNDETGGAFKAELHSDFKLLEDIGPLTSIHPFIGAETSSHGGYYVYGGPAADFALSPSWVLTPSLAVGYYEKGGSADLGSSHLQFRGGAEVAYRFVNGHKLGLELTHTSPFGTHDGAGIEAATVNYHVPFGVAGFF